MGQAIVSGRMNVENVGRAILKVTTNYSTTVTCKMGSSIMKKTSTATDNVVEFNVYFGSWEVSATIEGKLVTETIDITEAKIYTLALRGRTFGFSIDMSNTDPYTAVTYTDSAVGMKPLKCDEETGECDYGDWKSIIEDFLGVRPCVVENGSVTSYLNKDDYTKLENGEDTPNLYRVSDSSSARLMVEFKKMWYKYELNGDILTFSIADYDRSEDGFCSSAFYNKNNEAKDHMYYSVYTGGNGDGSTYYQAHTSSTIKNYSTGYQYTMYDCLTENADNPIAPYSSLTIQVQQYVCALLTLITKNRAFYKALGGSTGALTSSNSINNRKVTSGALGSSMFFGKKFDTIGNEKTYDNGNSYTVPVTSGEYEPLSQRCFTICDFFAPTTIIGIRNHCNDSTARCMYFLDYSNNSEEAVAADVSIHDSGEYMYGDPAGVVKYVLKMKPALNGSIIIPSLVQADNYKGWATHQSYAVELNYKSDDSVGIRDRATNDAMITFNGLGMMTQYVVTSQGTGPYSPYVGSYRSSFTREITWA